MEKMFPELKYYYVTCSEQVHSRRLQVRYIYQIYSPQRRRVLYKSLALVSILGVVGLVLIVRAQSAGARESGEPGGNHWMSYDITLDFVFFLNPEQPSRNEKKLKNWF